MANRLGIEMETERTEQGKLNQRGEGGESELVEEKSRQSRERERERDGFASFQIRWKMQATVSCTESCPPIFVVSYHSS